MRAHWGYRSGGCQSPAICPGSPCSASPRQHGGYKGGAPPPLVLASRARRGLDLAMSEPGTGGTATPPSPSQVLSRKRADKHRRPSTGHGEGSEPPSVTELATGIPPRDGASPHHHLSIPRAPPELGSKGTGRVIQMGWGNAACHFHHLRGMGHPLQNQS